MSNILFNKSFGNQNGINVDKITTSTTIISKPICFTSIRKTPILIDLEGDFSVLSKYNTLEYQNLDNFSSTQYGFQTATNGPFPKGCYIAPLDGIYTFNVSFSMIDVSDTGTIAFCPWKLNTLGESVSGDTNLFGSYNNSPVPVDANNRRSANCSILVKLNKGCSFHFDLPYNTNEINIAYCSFTGKYEGSF
jgi:hypothetical protein